MDFNAEGRSMADRALHPSKASLPISVRPIGNSTSTIAGQFLKARMAIVVTADGNRTEVMLLHSSKAS